MVKKSVTDEIAEAIEKSKASITLTLTKLELNDLFDLLFVLRQTDKGLVPEARDFQFQGKPQHVAASAMARQSIQGKVFELFKNHHGK